MSQIPGLAIDKMGMIEITRQNHVNHAGYTSHVDIELCPSVTYSNACSEQALLF
jgi:hypothetical protein